MLSRVADSIYWMSRYLERAASVARLVEVNFELTLDLPEPGADLWLPLVAVTGDREIFDTLHDAPTAGNITRFLTLDARYPNSILSCMVRARENARTVRDNLPSELWEEINALYLSLLGAGAAADEVAANPGALVRDVKRAGMLLGGIAQDAMGEGEIAHFFRAGRMMERADKTSRILDVKYFLLLPAVDYIGTPYDDIQWAALLRSLGAFQHYRRAYGRIQSADIVRMLVLDPAFPRSIRYSLLEADQSLRGLTGSAPGTYANPAERQLGQLNAALAYTEIESIFRAGLHEFIDDLQLRMNAVDTAIFQTFFSLPAPGPAGRGA